MSYFESVAPIRFEDSQSENSLAFHHYNPDQVILDKRLEEHLRIAASNSVWRMR